MVEGVKVWADTSEAQQTKYLVFYSLVKRD